jgi:hypothetical protein
VIYQRTTYEHEAVKHMADKRVVMYFRGCLEGLDGRISHYFMFSLHKDSVV